MAHGLSIGHVTDDVTWPPKVLWGSTVGYPSDSLATCLEKALATWYEETQKSYKCVRMLTALAYTALWNNITDTVYRLQIITKTKHFAVGMNLSMCRMGRWSLWSRFHQIEALLTKICAKTIFTIFVPSVRDLGLFVKSGSIYVKTRSKWSQSHFTHIDKFISSAKMHRFVVIICNYPKGPHVAAASWPGTY